MLAMKDSESSFKFQKSYLFQWVKVSRQNSCRIRFLRKRNGVTKYLFLCPVFALFSCAAAAGVFELPDETQQVFSAPSSLTRVPVQELEPPAPAPPSQVEVVWAMPPQAVDSFVIYYGLQKQALTKQVKVNANFLEKSEDPRAGLVYRYVLEGIDPRQPVYIAVSAVNGDTESEPSAVYELTADISAM